MRETINKKIASLREYWTTRTGNQKFIILGSILTALILVAGIFYFASKSTLVPLYTNLSPSETGSIKESLDAKGIKSEIADGGKTIKVPEEQVDTLLVELAAEGIPKSGNIDYSFFGANAGFGMTDNEFNVLKLEATQTELAELMKSIDGIEQAKVMITLPEKGIFLSDSKEEASASIILHTKPGHEFNEKQIKSLYHLVSKSIPNLPEENIVIRNQFLEYFDLNNEKYADNGYTQQMQIKSQIERDIQRQVQNMLGTLMGFDKVVTSVTADIDFTQENREENLVTPVDEENMRGIAISAHRITETFTGKADQVGGIPQGGDTPDAGTSYQAGSDSNGDYEKTEETINNEVNRIRKEIVESPYKIRDLGIQVMVEPPTPEDINTFPEDRKQDIRELLSTIVRTSIDKDAGTDLSDDSIQNKIVVSVQPFNGKVDIQDIPTQKLPWWIYVIGGVLLIIIGILLFLMLRARRNSDEEDEEFEETMEEPIEIPDLPEEVLTEAGMRKKQLEKLAKEKPDEFAKLLRTWLAED
ncbi:flagellar basal-body MS-ring/collar protein FliF [Lederbergia wuyishanensis]|uniref:Flagellar M-ring protein n=1 Tax=Lederbergia wuyishanensis TaxID=1347903 RepID=A0ABU0CZP6_9BACI|nr:flagellar basal-body MS-ring/collar protein FliF [Lederbergia wuyishanensis]MCJ8006261.1 flagellar M-ring protein FliF [Lederbergia wuyishanensis]MDQ0341630.1 flagellar M-ring protein FliF [Lederbergia wuyishanensis]